MKKHLVEQFRSAFRRRLTSRDLPIWLFGSANLLYWFALYVYLPTLPVYLQSRTNDLAMVGIILSMFGLWQTVIRLPVGIFADWVAWQKPFIIGGFALVGLGAWLMGHTGSIAMLALGRAIIGLGAGAWVPLVVSFSGLYRPEEVVTASSLLTFIGSFGRLLGSSLTGPLNNAGGYPLAFSMAAGAAAAAILLIIPAKEKVRIPKPPSTHGLLHLFMRRDVLLPSLLNAVLQYINWGINLGFLPLLAKELGADNVLIGLMVTFNLVIFILGNYMAALLSPRLGTFPLNILTFILGFAGLAAAALSHGVPVFFLALFFIGLSQGISYPILLGLSIQHVAPNERTTAMGLHQSVYSAGMFLGPWLCGMLAGAYGLRSMIWIGAAACSLLGLVGSCLMERGRGNRPAQS